MILLNSKKVDFVDFPYAEVKLNLDKELLNPEGNVITFIYESDSDLIKLMFVKAEVDSFHPGKKTVLRIAFMPYARMDREDDDTCFTLKYVSNFINYLNFSFVHIFEPHSDVSLALVDRSAQIELTKWLFFKAITDGIIEFDDKVDFVCYPDATAYKRYSKIGDFNPAIGMKDRDFATGWINNLEIFIPNQNSNPNKGVVKDDGVHGKHVVIVDDLSSKGGTFIMTAKVLKEMGAEKVTLVVGHCEPSILDGDVLKTDLIDCVITSNTILKPELVKSFNKMHVYDFQKCEY